MLTNILTMKSLITALGVMVFAYSIQAQNLKPATLSTNSTVHTIEQDGDVTYLGGSFTQIGFRSNYHSINPIGQNFPDFDVLQPNNQVEAAVPDGSGGWYISGFFTVISGQTAQRIAHILPDMSLDPDFSLNLNNAAYALFLDGDNLYIGGIFTQANDISVARLIRVNKNTGALDNGWIPQVNNGDVRRIYLTDDAVHAGGAFTNVESDNDQRYYAIFDKVSAESIPSYSFNSTVEDFLFNDDKLWISGGFSQTAIYQSYLAAFQTGDSDFPIFDFPDANSNIEVITPDGEGGWYMGGSFTTIDGVAIQRLVHLFEDGSVDNDFVASCNSTVSAIHLDGDDLFIGGFFTNVNGVAVTRVAKLNKTTGVVDETWLPTPNSSVLAISSSTDEVYLGGNFTAINGDNDNRYFAVLDKSTGALIQSQSLNSTVLTIEQDGDDYYLGGSFNQAGYWHQYLSVVDAETGIPDEDFPDANSTVHVTIPDGAGGWYMGGSFSQIEGVPALRIAHILSDGTLDPDFECSSNSTILALHLDGDDLYLGGSFSAINGTSIFRVARVNKNTGILDPSYNPNPNSNVNDIFVDNDYVYLAGNFFALDDSPLTRYFAVTNKADGSTVQTPSANSTMLDFESYGDDLLVSGQATQSGYYQPYIARVADGDVIPEFNSYWANSSIYVTEPDGEGGFYAGGSFSQFDGQSVPRLVHVLSDGTIDPDFSVTSNSTVHEILLDGNDLYIGGSFTNINGSPLTRLAKLNAESGVLDTDFTPVINNTVLSIGVDNNIVYAGGAFTLVEGETRNRIAAFNSDGSLVGSFDPNCNNWVEDILIHDGDIYLSGYFTTVGGVNARRVAAVNTSGALTSFDAGEINNVVFDMELMGNDLYIGGAFVSIDGTTRNKIASLNVNTGALQSFDTSIDNGQVWTLAINGNTLCAGGSFTVAEGVSRPYATEIDLTTGDLSDRNFGFNSNIRSVLYLGNDLIFGGDFFWLQLQNQPRILSFDRTTLDLNDPISSGINSTVHEMELDGDILYFGGSFGLVSGENRLRVAAIDLTDNSLLAFNPGANSTIEEIEKDGDLLYFAGSFTQFDGVNRNYVCAYDLNTEMVTDWNPSSNSFVYDVDPNNGDVLLSGLYSLLGLDGVSGLAKYNTQSRTLDQLLGGTINSSVYEILIDGDHLYAGGAFTNFGGESRNRFARYNLSTETIDPLSISFNNRVESMFKLGDDLYLSGVFTLVNEEPRGSACLFDLGEEQLSDWNPKLNSWCYEIVANESQVILGGPFNAIDVRNKSRIACTNGLNGNSNDWDLSINSTVTALGIYMDDLVFAGSFGSVDGQSRLYLASADLTTSELSDLALTQANNWIDDFVIIDDIAYVVGRFLTINDQPRNRGFGINLTDGSLTDYNPSFNNSAYMIETDGTNLFAGGPFVFSGFHSRNRFAAINADQNQVLDLGAGAGFNGTVHTISFDDENIYLGGSFGAAFGESRLRIASIQKSDGSVNEFNPGANSTVLSSEIIGDHLFFGGSFTNSGGENRNYICAFNIDDGSLNSFDPSPNSTVYDIKEYNGDVFFSGSFNQVGGNSRGYIASSNLDDFSLTDFNPGGNSTVHTIEFSDALLYAGGSFSNIGGETRQRLASLSPIDGSATAWNPVLNSTVLDIDIEENYLFAGGSFTTLNGESVSRLLLLDKNTGENLFNFAPSLNSTVECVDYNDGELSVGGSYTTIGSNFAHLYFSIFNLPPPGSSTFTVTLESLTDFNGFDIACNGDNDGQIEISVSGGTAPYSYTLTNADQAIVRTGDLANSAEVAIESDLPAGNYTIVVNDNGDGTANSSILLTEPSNPFEADLDESNPVETAGGSEASIEITISGGTAPFTYSYSFNGNDPIDGSINEGTVATIDGLSAGSYVFNFEDANGCTTSESIEIDDYVPVVVGFTIWDEIVCNGDDNGRIRIQANNGIPPYDYILDGPGDEFDRSGTLNFNGSATIENNLGPGIYTITITDQTAAEYSADDLELIEPDVLSVSIEQGSPVSTPGNNDGSMDVTVTGGVAGYFYTVFRNESAYTSSFSANAEFTVLGLIEGSYTITITDQNSCQASSNTIVLLDGVDPCIGLVEILMEMISATMKILVLSYLISKMEIIVE